MGLRIDDNSREAFQFLLLGAGIVLLLRAGLWALDQAAGPGADDLVGSVADATRNGYLVAPGTLVIDGTDLAGRLALATLFAVATGVLASLLGGGVANLLRREALRGAVRGARWGLLLGGAWGLYAVLFLPPAAAHIGDTAIRLQHRPALLGTLALPWPATERHIAWSAVEHLGTRSVGNGLLWQEWREEAYVTLAGEEVAIAACTPTGSDRAEARAQAQRLMAALAEALAPRVADRP